MPKLSSSGNTLTLKICSKCGSFPSHRQMFIVDDNILKCMTKRPTDAGKYANRRTSFEVYAENFICLKHQPRTVVSEVGRSEVGRSLVIGAAYWSTSSRQFCWAASEDKENTLDSFVEEIFNGTKHLVYLINGELIWACKRVALTNYNVHLDEDVVYLVDSSFMCAGVVDNRTLFGGDETKDKLRGSTV